MSNKYIPTKWVANETIGTASIMNNIEQGIATACNELEKLPKTYYTEEVLWEGDAKKSGDTMVLSKGVNEFDHLLIYYSCVNLNCLRYDHKLNSTIVLTGFNISDASDSVNTYLHEIKVTKTSNTVLTIAHSVKLRINDWVKYNDDDATNSIVKIIGVKL